MTTHIAHMRSWMFVPTSPSKFLAKIHTRPVDAIMPDLEDGVVASERPAGRVNLRAWLAERSSPLPVAYVRINSVASTEWREDLDAAIGADGVVLPKTNSVDDVATLVTALEELEHDRGLPVGSTGIVAAIESPAGLLNAPEIARHPRVRGLLFGAEDYALELGLPLARTGAAADLLAARSAIAMAARQGGAVAIDGVHTNLDDEDGLVEQSRLARDLGFSAKSLFHPAQIELINRAFTPEDDDIAFAREVIDRFAEAQRGGSGAVAVRGHLVDLPIAERARALLDLADELTSRDERRADATSATSLTNGIR